MDPLSQVPLECLHSILDFLVQDNNSAALAALLQTNRYFATVALPFLYKEPYRFTPFEATTVTRYDKNSHTPIIHRIPTRTLFKSLPTFTTLPKIVSLSLEPVDPSNLTLATTTPIASPSFDYLAQMRQLNQVPWAVGVDQLWKWNQPPPGVASFIITDEFENLCQDAKLIPVGGWSRIRKPKLEFYQRCFQILFFRESSWAIAEPVLEQLQSLTVPLSVVARYLESPATIQRLKRLKHFHFIMDKVFQDHAYDDSTAQQVRKEDLLFGPVLRFVKEHTRSFPGVMRTVISSHGDLWAGVKAFEASCPDRILLELNRMLPALSRPTFLNTYDHLIQFLAHPAETDLSRVVELDCEWVWVRSEYMKHILQENCHFLQRCRSLRTLRIEPVREGTFKWAVDKKRLSDQLSCMSFIDNDSHSMQDILVGEERELSTQYVFWRMGLAPLEDIQFSSNSRPWTDEINDAAVAFSHTLKRLRAATWSMDSEFLPVMHHIGMNWVNLPLLTCLHISIDRDRLVIDQELLMHCPNLVSLYLHDETLEYQCEDIQQSYLPAILPCLESLELKGWPALTFHPVTLHSTPSLKELSITCARYMVDEGRYSTAGPEEDDFIDFNCYIPPIAELYDSYGIPRSSSAFDIYDIPKSSLAFDPKLPPTFTRPKWTWDWYLPHLTSLTFSSEFAAMFEFRMLLGCPTLKTLELEWRTQRSSCTLKICENDLLTPTGDPIVVPSLTKLRMHGPCLFDRSCSDDDQFPARIFPNLESLSAFEWDDFPLDYFTNLVKTMPSQSLKEVFLNSWLFVEVRKEKELKLMMKEDVEKYNKEDVLAAVSIGIVLYDLLR